MEIFYELNLSKLYVYFWHNICIFYRIYEKLFEFFFYHAATHTHTLSFIPSFFDMKGLKRFSFDIIVNIQKKEI